MSEEWRQRVSRQRELEIENAKLRELCADVWMFTRAACGKYPRLFDKPAQGGQMVRPNMLDEFGDRMEALGIKVES